MIGGFVLLAAAGTAAAIKLSKKDADRIEEHTGTSVEELTEDELVAAMRELGIQSIELTPEDQAALTPDTPVEPTAGSTEPPKPVSPSQVPSEPSYLDELERLAQPRDNGVITEEDFEAKKQQLLGL